MEFCYFGFISVHVILNRKTLKIVLLIICLEINEKIHQIIHSFNFFFLDFKLHSIFLPLPHQRPISDIGSQQRYWPICIL